MIYRKVVSLRNIIRCSSTFSGIRPRRSLLYVPGNEEKKVKKASGLPADVVVLDCEDGVALSMKAVARSTIQKLLPSLHFGSSESVIRINSIDTEFASDDLKSVLTSTHLPDTIMVPKIETADQILWLFSESQKYMEDSGHSNKTLKVIGQTETPLGMMNLQKILESATLDHSNLRFEAFVFGSDDYLASVGGTRTKDAIELLFARQYFIMYVKGFGLQAIDMVDIDFKDLDGLKEQSEAGAKMGFTGKQVIHPAQIDIVNQSFSPSATAVEYAEEMIVAFHEHQCTGQGAFSFRGTMIDVPSVKQAQNILNLSKLTSTT